VKPRLLDAFCCAGGASVGYARAGFDVVGVDLDPGVARWYPFEGYQGDAVEFIRRHGHEFDAIVGSPPCQDGTTLTRGNRKRDAWKGDSHVNLIPATRDAMTSTGKPYIIENVEGFRRELVDPVRLCGLSFNLKVFRHRYFESNIPLNVPDHPTHRGHRVAGWRHGIRHDGDMFAVYGDGGGKGSLTEWQSTMEMPWVTEKHYIAEAIPPAYTEFLGRQLIAHLETV
jgi:hypothetical protein